MGAPGARFGFEIRENDEGTDSAESICVSLIGTDGTGKSLLALHAASQWLFDTEGRAVVLYASTDLSFHRAHRAWRDFALGELSRIEDVFATGPARQRCMRDYPSMSIKELPPYAEDKLFDGIASADGDRHPEIAIRFLDLRSHSRGDNWGYLNRIVAALPPSGPDEPLHMLVLDGVDGLEASGGEIDIFGLSRDRRSRIAQLLRTARGRCHVVLTVAAASTPDHMAEAYLADLVLRLRYEVNQDYERRVLSVEKARGQGHKRGAHPYFIRNGQRSTTGHEENPDDPEVVLKSTGARQAYIFVAPSLHLRNRELMLLEDKPIELQRPARVGFGCWYLDDLLGNDERWTPESNSDPWGFSAQTPTALIGEDGTFKSNLSKSFLAQGLRQGDAHERRNAIVLITTKIIDRESLALRLAGYVDDCDLVNCALDRMFVRRLEVHHISPAMFMHILEQCVRAAQRKVLSDDVMADEGARRAQGHRIRLVIDNWTLIQQSYPELAEDRRILPSILMFLRREGIATLILANEDSGFSEGFRLTQARNLRDLTSLHIYTWRVPFYGQARVAITVTPPQTADRRIVIRELKMRSESSRVPDIVPEFELFQDLEKGTPSFVRLRLHVHAVSDRNKDSEHGGGGDVTNCLERMHHSGRYWRQFAELSMQLMDEDAYQVECHDTQEQYEILKDLSSLRGPTRSSETVVLMLDEFWAKRSGHKTLRLQATYLTRKVRRREIPLHDSHFEGEHPERRLVCASSGEPLAWEPDLVEDPFRLFQPSELDSVGGKIDDATWSRADCFDPVGYEFDKYLERNAKTVVKVPFYWDFGFLMCDAALWEDAAENHEGKGRRAADTLGRVDTVWRSLKDRRPVSWIEFALAAREVAKRSKQSREEKDDKKSKRKRGGEPGVVHVLALPSDAGETLSCLLLEIWASEVGHDSEFAKDRVEEPQADLAELVRRYSPQLFVALSVCRALLGSQRVNAASRLIERFDPTTMRAAAARCWYSTATKLQAAPADGGRDRGLPEPRYVPTTLPGSYSVRGDWFLGATRGSRSVILAQRTIDLLCSRRGNIMRLQEGIGLPVRGNRDPGAAELWTALTKRVQSKTPMRTENYSYREIRELGARGNSSQDVGGRGDMQWIWRSRIRNYDAHARIWRRWVATALSGLVKPSREQLRSLRAAWSEDGDAWARFARLKDGLLSTLQRATNLDPPES